MKRRSIGNQRRHRKKKQEKKKTKLRAHTTYMFVSFVSIRASTDDFYLLASRCYWHGSYTRIIHCTTDHLAHLILCLYCYMFVAYIYIIYDEINDFYLFLFLRLVLYSSLKFFFYFVSHLVHSLPIWTSFQCVYSATSWSLVATCTCWAWAENTHKLIRLDLFIYSFFRLAPFFTQITCKHCIVNIYACRLFYFSQSCCLWFNYRPR